jgi:hypothetical protein
MSIKTNGYLNAELLNSRKHRRPGKRKQKLLDPIMGVKLRNI